MCERMTIARQKQRYAGVQSLLRGFAENGCLLLCLLSIIDEANDFEQDFLTFIQVCHAENLVSQEYFVRDALKILERFTARKWKMQSAKSLPNKIDDESFTVEHWHNQRTGFDHFRRRYADTLKDSVTVKEGFLAEYRIYSILQ